MQSIMQTGLFTRILVTSLILSAPVHSTDLAAHPPTPRAQDRGDLEKLLNTLAAELHFEGGLLAGDTVVVYAPWTEERELTALGGMVETVIAGTLGSVGRMKGYRVLPSTGIPETRGRVLRLGGRLRTGAGEAGDQWIEVDITLYAEPDLAVQERKSGRLPATPEVLRALSSPIEPTRQWRSFLFRLMGSADETSDRQGRVEVSLSADRYVEGDDAVIRFKSPMDGFAYVFCLIEDGSVSMLAPNQDRRQVQMTAGEWVSHPGEEERRLGNEIRTAPLLGHEVSRETIRVIVTDRPLEEFWKVPTANEGTLAGTDVKIGELLEILHSLSARNVRWACGQKSYTVERKR